MKRLITSVLIAGILVTPSTALAAPTVQSNDPLSLFSLKLTQPKTPTITIPKPDAPKAIAKPVEPPAPVPVVYTVVSGDNLSKIGSAHNVEWQRLWAKNTQLTNPDLINVGDLITIPLPSEQLARELPAVVALPAVTPGVVPLQSFAGGNTYDYGYCTWYVKNKRGASIPNSLGNANTWYSRAAAAGMSVGSTPRAGAVGTTTRGSLGHVVYVESVNADGSINISEMNAPTFGAVTTRTASAGEFQYIY